MENNFQLVPAQYSLAQEFGLAVPKEVKIEGYADGHPGAPAIDDGYVFQPEKMRDLLAFWQSGMKALKIKGDPATGKTSLVEQFHARLRWPLYMLQCKRTTEAHQLMGQLFPTEAGPLRWVDGPLLRAAREGTSVLLDEYNILDPAEATGLNLLLDGYPVTIESTGEIIKPAPGFRIFATENPVMSRLVVSGRNVQDAANDTRFMLTFADYLPAQLEERVVINALITDNVPETAAEMIASQVVAVANKVRMAYRDENPSVDKPMDTRSVIRWAKLIRRFARVKDAEGPVVYALRRSFDMSPSLDEVVCAYTRASLGTGTSNAP